MSGRRSRSDMPLPINISQLIKERVVESSRIQLRCYSIQYRRHISHQSRSGKRKENPHDQPQWPSRIIPQVPRPGLSASSKGDIPPEKDETQVYEAFRRAVFNVKIGNQDDHGKNFSFLYDEEAGLWRLSPAYDLTVSTTYYGGHSTSVCGKGKGITDDGLRRLADEAGLDRGRREEILRDVSAACRTLSVRP